MFEMTFPDGIRRGMAHDSPAHARNGVFMTPNGSMITRKDWGPMKRKLAYDVDLSATNLGTGEKPKGPINWQANHARNDLHAALKEFCTALGLKHETVADAVKEILEQHEAEALQAQAAEAGGAVSGKGAGALDDTDADEDEVAAKVREILAGMGWDDEKIEAALAKRREEGAEDVIPHSAIGHRLHGRSGSGSIRPDTDAEMEQAYPGISNVLGERYGVQPEPPRSGIGVGGRRMPAGHDAALTIEEQIEREYGPGPGIGMFGR